MDGKTMIWSSTSGHIKYVTSLLVQKAKGKQCLLLFGFFFYNTNIILSSVFSLA